MNPERWQQIEALYHAAAARPAGERAAFLAAVCGGDERLRQEVEALLDTPATAKGILAAPALAMAVEMVDDSTGAVLTGRRIGVYHLHERIGAGGMGEVYRARDTRLGRDVAIKILPLAFMEDRDRLARFEREARVLAAFTHPNIATIHGVEDGGDVRALVMELVDGETLAERTRRGPMPVAECVPLARQIVEALDAAHDKGIVHRDLKPANVKITTAGAVKVLDFGLAMAALQHGALASSAPTVTATSQGTIAGTAPYMSPEQARGQPVDKRTDIWAFGCVLYELLTGRTAFARETVTDTLAAVVNGEPDWTALAESVPRPLTRLIRRCLAKDPRQRLRDIGDARFDLQEAISEPLGDHTAPAPGAAGRVRLLAVAAASLVVGAGVAGVAVWSFAVGARPSGSAEAPSASVRVHRLTDARGLEEFPALSPDGRSVAFVAPAGGNLQIFVRLTAGGNALQLTRDAADHLYPRWSPDSASILYYSPALDGNSPGAIWEIPALGGPARRIASSLGGGDISRDGSRIVFPRLAGGRMELAVTGRDGSNARTLAPLEWGFYYLTPRWSPDDRLIAYQRGVSNVHEIFVVPAEGGQPRQITRHGTIIDGLTWAATGSRIVFSSSLGATIFYLPVTNLWSIDADGGGLRQLTFGETAYAYPDVNVAGTLVAGHVRREFDIWRFPVDGSPTDNVRRGTRITSQTSRVHTPSVAPDDSEVVYVSDSGGHANLWVTSLKTGESRQLTFEREPERRMGLPLWSPDRRQIAYFMARGSSYEYFLINADGSDSRLLMGDAGSAAWSPDAKWLYYQDYPTGGFLRKIPVAGGPPVVVRDDRAVSPAVGPDGETLYYLIQLPVVTGGSDVEIRVARPESAPSRLLARIPATRTAPWLAFQPVISPDGRWLVLGLLDEAVTNLWAVSTSSGQLRQLTDFGQRPTFITRRVSWSSDGRFIFAAVGEGDSDVVLLDGLKP
jgi:Tol biopolymer transport system component